MVHLTQREARSPHQHVRTRSDAVSTAQPPSACARQTPGHALSLPAARRQGAFLSSHGLRTWRSPSRSEGERQPRRGTWFPVSGCSGHKGQSGSVASPGGAPKGEGPRSLRTGGLLSMLSARWRTERQRPRHCIPTDTKVDRHDAVFSPRAEQDTRPLAWPDRGDSGSLQGG